ncbi:ribonuclease HII [Staphylococcus capitis]|uniref:ribonuclease HII n=1 Tax=Staphylococcus capitis TaxID=29388 RepID=UPI001D135233|nr:ribonuclease HII [Staphylococcus capitis]MCC3754965.1 ribonuclease HII [Staphylococcus capitis]MDH8730182.1 ribonuclease HII [Staphylococcus capitis]MDH8922697.1 ribonuclease HII [Staphylococcus capitis]MDH8944341.1 ribonuclease HII [Staphylococcus capitis]MDH9593241.1 ribonuclease HII [Staphylococcus capitis]
MTSTIKEIRDQLALIQSIEELEAHVANEDTRKGVQKAIESRKKYLIKQQELENNYISMNHYENEILNHDNEALICGIDEVGRGPLAGPVVACAVILNKGHHYLGLNDSKKVPAKQRLILNEELKNNVTSYAYGIATPQEIDDLNIYKATQVAMQRAINQLSIQPTHLLIDAMKLDNDITQTSIIKGDAKSVSIAAASIMAKEYRDNYMKELANDYPNYGFEKNVGYGTKQHLEAIDTFGVINEHRKSFEPIKSMLK